MILHITGDQLYADMLEHEPNSQALQAWKSLDPETHLLWHALASLENRQKEMREMLQAIRRELIVRPAEGP